MRIIIDLDGTLCSLRKEGQDYTDVTPNEGAIAKVQKLKEQGHYIIIQTARHMKSTNGNVGLINKKIGQKTMDRLDRYEIPYDEIFFGKPYGDLYIDDNAMRFSTWDVDVLDSYDDNKINVVIPMAGAGSRFKDAGYDKPKPLIDVFDKTMVERAVKSFDVFKVRFKLNFIFVIHRDHLTKYSIDQKISELYPDATIVIQETPLQGQAHSVLCAKSYINNFDKLIIYNADTYSKYVIDDLPIEGNVDGIIPCFESGDSRYSFAHLDNYGYVDKIVEKEVISSHATNGLYYFRQGAMFVEACEYAMTRDLKYKNEYYVGPLYNILIQSGKRIKICPIKENWVLGTPEEMNYFINNFGDDND